MSTQTRVIATSMSLAAFAVALVAGLIASNEPSTVLTRAILALFGCHLIGSAIGAVIDRVVVEHLDRYYAEHPVPEVPQRATVSAAALDDKKNG